MGAASRIAGLSIQDLALPAGAFLLAVAILGFLLRRYRRDHATFTMIDAVIAMIMAAVVGAAVVPIIEAATHNAKETTLLEDLRNLRAQIEQYTVEHGGQTPKVHEGTLPQLTRATNAEGTPGPAGSNYRFGPYLRTGVPVNPFTGRSIITVTNTFPPKRASGNGGWLYHPPTGQIAPDIEEYLAK